MRKKGKKSVVLKILLAIAVVVGVYAIVLVVSYKDLEQNVQTLAQSYEVAEASVSSGDMAQALSSAKEICAQIDQIEDKLNGWQWQVAGALPVLGDDVRCADATADVCDALANDAAMPVVSRIEKISNTVSSSSGVLEMFASGKVSDTLSDINKLTSEVTHAREVVDKCAEDVKQIPQAHIAELNDLVANLRDAVQKVDELLDTADSIISSIPLFNDKTG